MTCFPSNMPASLSVLTPSFVDSHVLYAKSSICSLVGIAMTDSAAEAESKKRSYPLIREASGCAPREGGGKRRIPGGSRAAAGAAHSFFYPFAPTSTPPTPPAVKRPPLLLATARSLNIKAMPHNMSLPAGQHNAEGINVDLYIPRKWCVDEPRSRTRARPCTHAALLPPRAPPLAAAVVGAGTLSSASAPEPPCAPTRAPACALRRGLV